MKRRDAFTLTELLVIVPIIALLGTLMLASLDDAKQTLQAAARLNNKRQWGLAFGLYCNDYHDYMPYEGQSFGELHENSLPGWRQNGGALPEDEDDRSELPHRSSGGTMDRRLVGVYGKRYGQSLILRPEGPYSIALRGP